jgi:hypothetical protein
VPVTNALPRMAISPPIELQPARSPFLIGSLPTTSAANPDSIRNFTMPGIPSYRITPPPPITQSSGAANTTIGVKTVPRLLQPTPAPTIASPLVSIPTGFQFSFFQVRLPLQDTLAIASYKVYRNTASTSASATVIQSIVHHQANVGIPVIIQDNQPNGAVQNYWVSSVSTSGQESTLTPAQSASVTSNAGFNTNSQLASSFHSNPVNVSATPTSSTLLSNDGSGFGINISASTLRTGAGDVTYSSGTVSPGSFGTWFIFADDPQFQGGSVIYQASGLASAVTAADGRVSFGAITTVSGTPNMGGGFSGGTTPGGSGGRGFPGL